MFNFDDISSSSTHELGSEAVVMLSKPTIELIPYSISAIKIPIFQAKSLKVATVVPTKHYSADSKYNRFDSYDTTDRVIYVGYSKLIYNYL